MSKEGIVTDAEKIELLDLLINNLCEIEGVRPTISYIMGYGYTEEQMVEGFGFDKDDVQAVLDGEIDDIDM